MLYLIECREIIELYEDKDLVDRADSITVVANEHDPFDWHGSMIFGKDAVDIRDLSSRRSRVLMVTFNCSQKNYMGLIRITEGPLDMGQSYQVKFNGVDLLQAK